MVTAEKLINGLPKAFPAYFTDFDPSKDDICDLPCFKSSFLASLATAREKAGTAYSTYPNSSATYEVLKSEEVEPFVNEIELLKDDRGLLVGRKYFKPYGGWLAGRDS